MLSRTIFIRQLTVALTVAFAGPLALADDKPDRQSRVSHDEVLAALQRNEIRPLQDILAAAAKVFAGPVVKVEVKRKAGRLIYEVKIVSERGRVREVYVDAASLEIVKVE